MDSMRFGAGSSSRLTEQGFPGITTFNTSFFKEGGGTQNC